MTSYYYGKKVLITGGCSFIGSHLADDLIKDGAAVTVVDNLSSGKLKNLHQSDGHFDFINGDLRCSELAMRVAKGQDLVFHLANIHGGRGFIDTHPGEICQNFLIDGNVFRSALLNEVDRVCFTSSACVYPTNLQTGNLNHQQRFLSEEMADPFKLGCTFADREYGWAKFMGEMTLKSYNMQFSMHGVSCRLFTVYGPRESESHAIIALIAKAFVRQDPYEIWGSGSQDRNFTYVEDVIKGLKLSVENITDCRAINIGTDVAVTIEDAAKMICRIIGHDPANFYFDRSKPEGVYARSASISNQLKWLNWFPQTSLKDGLRTTIDWYLSERTLEEAAVAVNAKLFER